MAVHTPNASDGEWWNLEQLQHFGSKVAWVSSDSDFRIWWKLRYLAEILWHVRFTTLTNGWNKPLQDRLTTRQNLWISNWGIVMSMWVLLSQCFCFAVTMETICKNMSVRHLDFCIFCFIMERFAGMRRCFNPYWIVWKRLVAQSWNFLCIYNNNSFSWSCRVFLEPMSPEVF